MTNFSQEYFMLIYSNIHLELSNEFVMDAEK